LVWGASSLCPRRAAFRPLQHPNDKSETNGLEPPDDEAGAFGQLPRACDQSLYEQKCSALFEHIHESYLEKDRNILASAE